MSSSGSLSLRRRSWGRSSADVHKADRHEPVAIRIAAPGRWHIVAAPLRDRRAFARVLARIVFCSAPVMLSRFASIALLVAACGGSVVAACGGSVVSVSDNPDASADAPSTPVSDASRPTPTPAPADGSVACVTCLDADLAWRNDGGFAPTGPASSTLSGCFLYSHSEQQTDVPPLSCTQNACGGANALTTARALALLRSPSVRAAFARGGLFGFDSRPADGVALVVTFGGQTITIGDACMGRPSCDLPVDLATLADLLREIDAQQTSTGTCGQLFHGK